MLVVIVGLGKALSYYSTSSISACLHYFVIFIWDTLSFVETDMKKGESHILLLYYQSDLSENVSQLFLYQTSWIASEDNVQQLSNKKLSLQYIITLQNATIYCKFCTFSWYNLGYVNLIFVEFATIRVSPTFVEISILQINQAYDQN